MLGSCTVCLGLSGSGSYGELGTGWFWLGLVGYVTVGQGSRGLSCRGHVRCSKEWIGSHGKVNQGTVRCGEARQPCLGSDSHCMYGYGSHVKSSCGDVRYGLERLVPAVKVRPVAVR